MSFQEVSFLRIYVVFGDYTEKLCQYLSPRYEIAGSDRTVEAAVAAARSFSQPPDVFLVLGSALTSGLVGGRIDHGAALVQNLKDLRKSCPTSRVVVVLSLSVSESLVQEIAKLGIYDVHRAEEVQVGDLIYFIDNPKNFGDFDVDVRAAGKLSQVIVREPDGPAKASWKDRFQRAFRAFSSGRASGQIEFPPRARLKVARPQITVAVGLSLPGIPAVEAPPASAAIVFFAPDKADPSLLPPGAKGCIVGSDAAAWRKAALTGLPVVSQEKAATLAPVSRAASCTVVYSSSTAVGKTSVAFTLAALLAKERRVCLVDTDSGKPTLTHLVTGQYDTAGSLETPFSTKWGFSFVPNAPDETSVQEAKEAVGRLLAKYDEVVVDCPGRLNLLPCMEAFLRKADRVLLVSDCTNRSVAAVRNFAVGGMRELGIADKTLLVVNRKEARPFLKPKEVAERVGMPLHLELPHDALVERMFEERQPLTHFKTKKPSPFLAAVEKLLENKKEGGAKHVQSSLSTNSPG